MEQLPSLVEHGFRRAFITLVAIICTFLSVINMSVLSVAFSDIRGNLDVSLDEVTWVMTAYSLANIVIMPFSSWLSGHLGRRNYFAIAAMLFTLSSFFCGNANGIQELIIFRFLQGLGGGAMLVLSHTIITESWPVKKWASSQAFFILGMLAGVTLAPPFGGYIIDHYTWPYIFYANIPIGIIACLLILACVRKGAYEKREDWLGALMLVLGTSSLYLVLARGQQEEWLKSPFILVLSLVGLTGIILFIRRQIRFIAPLGETGLLVNVNLRTGLILSFITAFGVAASSMIMVSTLGWGIQVSPMLLWTNIRVLIVMLGVAAILIEKGLALKYMIATGMLVFTIYAYMLYRTVPDEMGPAYIILLMLRGLAVALLSVSVSTLALSKLEGKQLGEGVALYNIIRQLGGALGIALFSIYADQQAALKRIDIGNISPEAMKRVSELMAAKGVDSSIIKEKGYALLHTNAMQQTTAYTPHLFMLFVAIAFLICIPLVLYFIKNRSDKDQ